MKTFDRILRRVGLVRETKATPLVQSAGFIGDSPQSKFIDYTSYLEAGTKIDTVARCCAIISDAVVSAKWWIMDDQDRIIDSGPLIELLKKPNPTQTWREIKGRIIQHLLLTGNAFLVKERGLNPTPNSKIRELLILQSNRVEVKKDQRGMVVGYDFIPKLGAKAIHFKTFEIIHFKLPNPNDPYYGLGKIEQGEVIYNLDQAAKKSGWKFFENGAVFSATLEMEGAMAEDAKTRLRADIGDKNVGWFKWHKFLILDRGLKLKSAQATNRDMEYINLLKYTREMILLMFGVPPAKAGVLENANYSNSKEQDHTFNAETVTPLLDLLDDKLTHELTMEFNPKWRHVSDDIVKDDEDIKSQIAARYFSIVGLTPNEIREDFLGFKRLDVAGMDTPYIGLNLIPVGEFSEGSFHEEDPEERRLGLPAMVKSISHVELKQTSGRNRILLASRRIRSVVGHGMERELRKYFADQRDRIIRFLEKSFDRTVGRRSISQAVTKAGTSNYDWGADDTLIDGTARKFQDRTISATIDVLGQLTGTRLPDDAPRLVGPRARLGMRIKRINETTRRELDDQIATGIDRAYSLEQIIEGVPEDDFKGVKGTFKEATTSRARRIARTEMSAAFDQVANVNYQEVGIQTVDVIGCEDNDIVPGQTFGCNSSNIPIAQAASIEFHPNHTGTIVPSR